VLEPKAGSSEYLVPSTQFAQNFREAPRFEERTGRMRARLPEVASNGVPHPREFSSQGLQQA
jgi:hypothetical protein